MYGGKIAVCHIGRRFKKFVRAGSRTWSDIEKERINEAYHKPTKAANPSVPSYFFSGLHTGKWPQISLKGDR